MSASEGKADIGLAPGRAVPPFVQDDTHIHSKFLGIVPIPSRQRPVVDKGLHIRSGYFDTNHRLHTSPDTIPVAARALGAR